MIGDFFNSLFSGEYEQTKVGQKEQIHVPTTVPKWAVSVMRELQNKKEDFFLS